MPNELKETMELMNSADYKDRFKAEYYQVAIRYQKPVVLRFGKAFESDRSRHPE